jgi:nicotinamidase/pyrazinamidase
MNKIIVSPYDDALVAVDVQPTFMPGGSLPVLNGDSVLQPGRVMMYHWPNPAMRFATQDFHPHGHISFANSYVGLAPFTLLTEAVVAGWTDKQNLIAPNARFSLKELKDYLAMVKEQMLWPDHAKQNEAETEIHPTFHRAEFKYILRKGMDHACDSYSAFEDNLKRPTGFADVLHLSGARRCFFWGLALDYCVRFSAEGAARHGFETFVIEDATRAVTPAGAAETARAFANHGIKLVHSDDLELNLLMRGGG